jgi:hypothetical protein
VSSRAFGAGLLVLLAAGCAATAPQGRTASLRDPQQRGPQGEVAQFVVECAPSHAAFDDPIVHPGMAGMSHLHQFFGNSRVDGDTDYDRLVGAPTSCDQPQDTASYWVPALLDASGSAIEPIGMTAYYRSGPGVDPADVGAYPAGLELVAGDAMATEPQSPGVVAWSCGSGADRSVRPPACPPTTTLRLVVTFPDCWDGEHLDWTVGVPTAVYSEAGCPQSHPLAVPQLTVAVDYPSVDPEELSLASGSIITGHADFWNVWDQDKLEREVELCLNRDVVCGVAD